MRKRVLLIDDEIQMLDELSSVFNENNIDVLKADSGKASLEIAEKEPYNVAVVDIKLPDFNGVDLIDKLREKKPDSIYLLITGYASMESAIKALRKGVFDYIVKPFNSDELVASVKNAFMAEGSMNEYKQRADELLKNKNALAVKLLKLEKLNNILMGRENRIMELKREVNCLLRRLNENIKYGV